MSLNNYMPRENRKRQKSKRQKLYTSWECFYQTLNNYILHENKIRKNINPFKTLCRTQSKNFYTKVRKVSLENTTTWKIKSSASSLNLCASNKLAQITALEATRVSDQDEAEIQYDRLSTLESCNCEKCEKMSISLECLCYNEIPAVKAFHLKFLEFFAVGFNCVGNHFLEDSFSEIS